MLLTSPVLLIFVAVSIGESIIKHGKFRKCEERKQHQHICGLFFYMSSVAVNDPPVNMTVIFRCGHRSSSRSDV